MTVKYWIGGTATWNNTNDASWSLSSGGPNNTTHPVSGDDVKIDANSGGGTVTRASAAVTCSSLDLTGFTGTFAAGTTNTTLDGTGTSGNLTLTSAWTPNSGVWTFTGTGTQTLTTAGVSLSPITVNVTGTVVLADDATLQTGRTFTLTKGTLNLNGHTLTCDTFSSSNANTRAITWTSGGTITNVGTFTLTTTTGLTFTNPTQGALGLKGSATTSIGAGLTIPPTTITGIAAATCTLNSGSNFESISMTTAVNSPRLSLTSDITVNGNFVCIPNPLTAYAQITGTGATRTLTVNGNFDVLYTTVTAITGAGKTPFYVRHAVADLNDGGTNTNVRFVTQLASPNLLGVG